MSIQFNRKYRFFDFFKSEVSYSGSDPLDCSSCVMSSSVGDRKSGCCDCIE